MSTQLRHVLSPISIGPVAVPNRVVRTGHGTGLGGGTMSDMLIAYHRERARGGVGLTILELLHIAPSAYPFLVAGADGLLAGYRKLMAAVAPHGMRVFQQIGHLGNEVAQPDGSPPWSSSDTVGAMLGVQARAMSKVQIDALIEGYRAAARLCEVGGLDGIELHMAHGYLVQQFLSPLHNRRTDAYGGSFENRTRLAVELLTAVRNTVSPSKAIGVRLSAEHLEGGMGPAEVSEVARLFEQLGLIDYVNLSIGTDYNPHKIIGAMHEPVGYELASDVPVKKAVGLPVIVTGRFRTLEEAEQVIAAGEADLVAMNRAHIADPDLVRKTLDGRADEVRPCIGCNHGCIGGLLTVGRLGCAVNVAAGNEEVLSEDLIERTATPKTVLVVGGGPAGLEAARVAALKGHSVVLVEAMNRLGGTVNVAKRAPRRLGIGDIVDWLEREVYRLGVDVRLSTYVEADDVRAIAPDVVIVATGSSPRLDGRQMHVPGLIAAGIESSLVVSSHELLLETTNRDWGKSALVFDDAGHYEGIAAAEFLIEHGLSVTFATGHSSFAPNVAASLSSEPALERLARGDFRLLTYAKLIAIDGKTSRLAPRYGGKAVEVEADTVVFVSHNACNDELLDTLGDYPGIVVGAGDVLSPRYLQTAIREGHLAARSIA